AIQGKKSPYGVVLYDTCSQEMPMEEGKKLDEYLLRHVLLQKSTTKKSKRLGNSFSHITKQAKHKPDIIGYFNS
ncbi:TPA: hypothetical protein DEP21_05575, partial [Patescibacteria group bacterium]|nr:hypothetical protein [Candidatus Gracilibacteria bacterium]